MRIVLTDQDLSGQTIEGQPLSYIGRCTGTDIKFTGDWTHVSHFGNDFLRPDWSKAQTRWSYSRFNTFTDAIVSQDVEAQDHEMMLALFLSTLPQLKGKECEAAEKLIEMLAGDIARREYQLGWANMIPPYISAGGEDPAAAFGRFVGEREHLVQHATRMGLEDSTKVCWEDNKPPSVPLEGVATSAWGLIALNKDGRRYSRHWSELPKPKNPHDRVEMAELIEAEVEAAVGYPITVYIQQILCWSCRVDGGPGRPTREKLAPGKLVPEAVKSWP